MFNVPIISVIMPVLNGGKYLAKAIQSILDQTFTDFEFIIVNDGSTDKTEEIIKSFSDPRIHYIDNGTNLGLSKSYNKAIDASRGEYIARMDADDVSEPRRFERQISFLKRHPHVDIVGTSVSFIDENGFKKGLRHRQEDHVQIKFSSLFSTPMMHPTIMSRSSVFKSHHYDESLHNSEDYDLWSRLLFETKVHFANIWEPLLCYRTYPNSFTQTLNLDKRVVSAHNTIKNIGHYLHLSEREKNLLVDLRKEKALPTTALFRIFYLYLRTAQAFIKQERLGAKRALRIYLMLLPHAVFLLKYGVKRLIKK